MGRLAVAAILLAAGAAGASAWAETGDPALGAYLAGECLTCHQASGAASGIPSIVGWPAAAFVAAFGDYQARRRANPIMQMIAARYSSEEIAALAAYFGSLGPKAAP
jgi:cytochrome c